MNVFLKENSIINYNERTVENYLTEYIEYVLPLVERNSVTEF